MREDADIDLVNAMKPIQEREAEAMATIFTLNKICEAAQPIADIIEPPV